MTIDLAEVLQVLGETDRPSLSLKSILTHLGVPASEIKGRRNELRALLGDLMRQGRAERVGKGYRMSGGNAPMRGPRPSARTRESPASASAQDPPLIASAGGLAPLFAAPSSEDDGAGHPRPLRAPRDEWVGIFESRGRSGRVLPYRDALPWRVRVDEANTMGAKDGEVVVVVPSGESSRGRGDPRGRVSERLGMPGEVEADFRAVAWRHRLPAEFEPASQAEAAAIPEGLDPEEIARRVDLRERPFLTIDPGDARDHDDALCVEFVCDEGPAKQHSGDIRLYVAIADVSHYVPEGSSLDREALARGNSVYFPGRVIPMLPERISADLCSLRPDCDRFAMVVEMRIDSAGDVSRASFYPAVMRSRARLSYEVAADVMARPESRPELQKAGDTDVTGEVAGQLHALAIVARRLLERRFSKGSIDFDVREGRVILDEQGFPSAIVESERSDAHRAVEEAMLAANRAVSRRLGESPLACIHRIHEAPERGKLETLRDLLESFGLVPSGAGSAGKIDKALSSRQIQRALEKAQGHPEARLVNMVALRSMKQARYAAQDRGHFALAFDAYLHFTSPIRRYADLFVHRQLKRWLVDASSDHKAAIDSGEAWVERVANHVSYRERVAVDAEREIVSLKKCAFMARYVGVEFDGCVTGVTQHGLFVTLDDFFVDGLVHISQLGDDLVFDERAQSLVGRRSGHRHGLGDSVRVRVESVNLRKGWIRFVPAVVGGPGSAGRLATSRAPGEKGAKRAAGAQKPARKARRAKPQARRRGVPSRGRGRRS